MESKNYHSGSNSGFQYERHTNPIRDRRYPEAISKYTKGMDDDLIIEDNTVYEIDRECFERLSRKKKR